MSKQHVMLDIETFGKGSYAAVIALGAVKFSPREYGCADRFYARVDVASSMKYGMRVDGSTIDWWMDEKRDTARKALYSTEAIDLDTALSGFAQWFGPDSLPTWGNGATFDNVIVANAFSLVGIDCPWSYKDERCFRTMRALAGDTPKPERVGTEHQAVDDAQWQAHYLQLIVAHRGLVL